MGKLLKKNHLVFALLLTINLLILLVGFKQKDLFTSIETEHLIIRSAKGSSYLELKMVDQKPLISLYNDKGKPTMEMIGGNFPSISLRNQNGIMTTNIATKEKGVSQVALFDSKGDLRLELVASESAAIYLKDHQKKTVASLTLLADGGAGLGLANNKGTASTVLRGGSSPGVVFFGSNEDPTAALGVVNHIPHLLVKGQEKMESVLIHGGKPMGFLLMDENGKPKIMISKHGVFQGKEEEEEPQGEKNRYNFFSWSVDQPILFPDAKKTSS